MKKRTFLLIFACISLSVGARQRVSLDRDWRFTLADSASFAMSDYNDSHWRRLNVPHDWAIEGDFHANNKSGASGGALPGGVGWYRRNVNIRRLTNEKLFLSFDGVYMNSTVYVNGRKLGFRPYGYSSFEYDITPFVHDGNNSIAVRVDNSDQPNSRWYSGCGIYRHVWLTRTYPVHIRHWGVYIRDGKVEVAYENPKKEKVTVRNIWSEKGRQLWSPDNPKTYKVRTQLLIKGKVVDEVETVTGFRRFRFDAKTGFWLNGKNMKLNGVCLHHDLGCLGAALNEDALHRQLTKLKQMGCNAIRCSHNPPAPELLAMCDTMGFIVMDESFDMWKRRKTKNDYARFFDTWAERDLSDMVLRDRNHPSVLIWSIGNEVLEQWSGAEADTLSAEQANLILNAGRDTSMLAKKGELSFNSLLTKRLVDIVHRYDTSRPVTAGCNEPSPDNHLFRSGALDIIGFNYHHQWAKDVPKNFPNKPFLFTESVSALQSRGCYKMPSDSIYQAPRAWWEPYTDPTMECSAYDNMHTSWSCTHEAMWEAVKHTPYVAGQFIWTGWDYIGEPTPYDFPARSSYFGIIDLAGFPKDIYYMYQSEWTSRPVLHLFPHWNWLDGQEIDLWCYYNNADEVELFVNGRSQGTRRKTAGATASLSGSAYHVGWRVCYEPGEIKVVARQAGKVVGEQTRYTAGQPSTLRLNIDYRGRDLSFVFVDVCDDQGTICPHSDAQVFFTAADGLEIVAVDNGCPFSMERFKDDKRRAYHGRCMVVVRGKGTLTARSYGLKPQNITIQ